MSLCLAARDAACSSLFPNRIDRSLPTEARKRPRSNRGLSLLFLHPKCNVIEDNRWLRKEGGGGRERGEREKKEKREKAKDREWRRGKKKKMGQLKSMFKAISDVSVAQARAVV